MICPNCKSEIDDKSKNCPDCGAEIAINKPNYFIPILVGFLIGCVILILFFKLKGNGNKYDGKPFFYARDNMLYKFDGKSVVIDDMYRNSKFELYSINDGYVLYKSDDNLLIYKDKREIIANNVKDFKLNNMRNRILYVTNDNDVYEYNLRKKITKKIAIALGDANLIGYDDKYFVYNVLSDYYVYRIDKGEYVLNVSTYDGVIDGDDFYYSIDHNGTFIDYYKYSLSSFDGTFIENGLDKIFYESGKIFSKDFVYLKNGELYYRNTYSSKIDEHVDDVLYYKDGLVLYTKEGNVYKGIRDHGEVINASSNDTLYMVSYDNIYKVDKTNLYYYINDTFELIYDDILVNEDENMIDQNIRMFEGKLFFLNSNNELYSAEKNNIKLVGEEVDYYYVLEDKLYYVCNADIFLNGDLYLFDGSKGKRLYKAAYEQVKYSGNVYQFIDKNMNLEGELYLVIDKEEIFLINGVKRDDISIFDNYSK